MTWVTLPNMGLEGQVEALGASSKHLPEDNPEDDDGAWKPICVEPCGLWVRPGTRLRVNGKFGVSRPFTLPAGPRVHLAVNPGRYDMRRAGIIVMSASAFAPAVTGMWFLVNHLGFPASNDEERRQDEARQAKALDVFKVGVLIGGIGIATGATLLLTNIRTTVTPQASGPAGAAAVSTPPRVSIGRGFWLSPSGVQF